MRISKLKKLYFGILPNTLIVAGLVFLSLAYGPVIVDEVWFWLKEQKGQEYVLQSPVGIEDSVFARFISTSPVSLDPVNRDFSILIERLGVNAPVVADVKVTDKDVYFASLKKGVAHASTSDYPSEHPGNVYLFAHSSVNFWELGRYAKVFNLLRKLEYGDRVHVFFRGKDFVYEVVNREVKRGWNTYPLTRPVIEPILTMQTCDPPGTTINRLVVTAKLLEIK